VGNAQTTAAFAILGHSSRSGHSRSDCDPEPVVDQKYKDCNSLDPQHLGCKEEDGDGAVDN